MHRTQADARLDALLSEPGRRGLLRRELTGAGLPAGQADRALRKACMAGTIERVGHGIYAVGDARIAEIMPEVLPKLGYRILPTPPLRNYSIRRSGVTYRLDKPCRRLVMRRGVVATYENRKGGLIQPDWNRTMSQRRDLPMGFEIDLRRRSMEYCHSTARAEKDLIVDKALEAYDEYQDPEAGFALDGGTSLSKAYGAIRRFSEDVDINYDIRAFAPDPFADAGADTVSVRFASWDQQGQWERFEQEVWPEFA